MRCASSAVISVPFVERTQRRPRLLARAASTRISGLSRGSPPEKMIVGEPKPGAASAARRPQHQDPRPPRGLAAGENDGGRAEAGDVIDEAKALLRGQLARE